MIDQNQELLFIAAYQRKIETNNQKQTTVTVFRIKSQCYFNTH
mgnify:FL=1